MSTFSLSRSWFGAAGTSGPTRHRYDVAWLAIALAGSALSSGCMQILGLEERSAAGADGGSPLPPLTVIGQCGGLPHGSTSCAACMDQSCCSDAKACGGDPSCEEASTCLAGCTDDACRSRCGIFYATPNTLMSLRACRVNRCAAACGSRCGEMASPISACDTCLQATCCTEAQNCAANPQCAALQLCHANCFSSTSSCTTDCDAKYPQGAADFEALFRCSDQCAAQCLPGQDWTCLDRPIIWPKPKGIGMITFSVTFVDYASERPFVGLTVKACGKIDYSCASPIDQSSTDTDGKVSLTVSGGTVGFDGYLDLSDGKIDGTGDSAYHQIWYPMPFVVADGWRGRTLILSNQVFQLFTLVTGSELDPTHGHFTANTADCDFTAAPGVSYVVDPSAMDAKTKGFYLVNGSPAANATATDTDAIGGFINLPSLMPAKVVNIGAVATVAGGQPVGSLSLIVRPGTLTTMSSYPPIP